MSRKAQHAIAEARRAKVAILLMDRVTYRNMAAKLGVSLGTIAKDVKALLGRWAREQNPDERYTWLAVELAKLSEMERIISPKARKGDLAAIDRILRIMERRARLVPGLEAPQRFEPEGEWVLHVVHDDPNGEQANTTPSASDGTPADSAPEAS